MNDKPAGRDEPGESLKTSFSVSKQVWRRAKIRAMDEEIELQELIAKAIEMYLKAKPRPKR